MVNNASHINGHDTTARDESAFRHQLERIVITSQSTYRLRSLGNARASSGAGGLWPLRDGVDYRDSSELYYEMTPPAVTYKLARPTMLPAYDWQNTRAFSLPTDQYGWIRINLTGRESEGIVAFDEYDILCAELEQMLLNLRSENGEALVKDVSRTSVDALEARHNPLPDLVVHWHDAAFGSSLRIKGSNMPATMVSMKTTGQHAPVGFCIDRGKDNGGLNGVIEAKDLWRLIAASL